MCSDHTPVCFSDAGHRDRGVGDTAHGRDADAVSCDEGDNK